MNDMQRRREVARQAAGDTPAVGRLHRCGLDRDHRGDLWRCNRVPCPDCGQRTGDRFARRTVLPLVRVARPCGYQFYLVTVVLPPDLDIDIAGDLLEWAKRAIKDRLLRIAGQHPNLAGWWLAGGYEMDMLRDHQFDLLGLGKRQTLAALAFPHGEFGAAVWLPHLHLILALPPGSNAGLVRAELADLFPATRQVEMRPLEGNGTDEAGVRRVTRYPYKHLLRVALPRYRAPESWNAEEVTTYALWAERFSSQGYRGFRFVAGDRRFIALVEAALDAEDEGERREMREMMAEEEWLYGAGSAPPEDHDVLFDLGDAAVLQCDGDEGRVVRPSSSSGGVYTTRHAPTSHLAAKCRTVRIMSLDSEPAAVPRYAGLAAGCQRSTRVPLNASARYACGPPIRSGPNER